MASHGELNTANHLTDLATTVDTMDESAINDMKVDEASFCNYGSVDPDESNKKSLVTSSVSAPHDNISNDIFDEAQAEAFAAFGIIPEYGSRNEKIKMERSEPLTGEALAKCGIQPEDGHLIASLEGNEPIEARMSDQLILTSRRRLKHKSNKMQPRKPIRKPKKKSFFGRFVNYPELFMELAKQMDVKTLLSLYSISKDFHDCINGHMSHVMKSCAAYRHFESSRIFLFTVYEPLCMPDPVGRSHPVKRGQVRKVPSLRWLAMIEHREKIVRDILALMAREGHRMPKTMSVTLKKMWFTMDIATSARRVQFMHNEKYWTDGDIYNVQLFLIKLDMRFNDPLDGPGDDGLKKLFMGQRGLTPLRDLLKRTRFTSATEIIQLAARYACEVDPEHENMSLLGIPPNEIGRGHLEGWGQGGVHLYRMDELVIREAVRRNLELDHHMISMLLWGYVDPVTKKNIEPTAEEMYMSDDEGVVLKVISDNKGTKPDEDENDEDENVEVDDSVAIVNELQWETGDEDMVENNDSNDIRDTAVGGF